MKNEPYSTRKIFKFDFSFKSRQFLQFRVSLMTWEKICVTLYGQSGQVLDPITLDQLNYVTSEMFVVTCHLSPTGICRWQTPISQGHFSSNLFDSLIIEITPAEPG
eukprot:234993_1